MKIRSIREMETSRWSGGTTTQFVIFPEKAVYANRDFLFRISSAVVEDEHAVFTSLPGYERILMVLDGKTEIVHRTEDTELKVTLGKYDTTRFYGSWPTESYGAITDFNVIFSPRLSADVQVMRNRSVEVDENAFLFAWCMEGRMTAGKEPVAEGFFIYGKCAQELTVEVEGIACVVRISGELSETV